MSPCHIVRINVTASSVQAGPAQVQWETAYFLRTGRGRNYTPIPITLFLGQFQSILPSQAVEICTSAQKNELLAVSSTATGPANQELGQPCPPPGQRASWAPGAGAEGPKGGPCLRTVPQAAGKEQTEGGRDKGEAYNMEDREAVRRAHQGAAAHHGQAGSQAAARSCFLEPDSLTVQSVWSANWNIPSRH